MEISPGIWFLVPNNVSDCSKFSIYIPNKKCEDMLRRDDLKIYKCKSIDFVRNLKLGRLNLELGELLNFSEDHINWEKTNDFEIINEDRKYHVVLNINIDNKCNEKLFMLCLGNDDYHIININEIHNDFFDFGLKNHLIKLNVKLIRDFLLKGLNNIELNGTPGQIHCFGERTFGLFCGKNHNRGSFSWCSGISLCGDGAILSFSHESFLLERSGHEVLKVVLKNFFQFKGETKKEKCVGFLGFSDYDSSNFIRNISNDNFIYSRGSLFESVELSNIEKSISNHKLDIIVINGNKEQKKPIHETKLSSKILKSYIFSGNLIIIGLCPWGWEYISGGRLNSHSISNGINKEMGMIFTNEYFCNEENYINIQNSSNCLLSSFYYWKELINSINKGIKNELNIDEYFLMTKDIECHLNMDLKTTEQNKILNLIVELLKKKTYLKLRPPFNMEEGINILNMAIACSRLIENKLDVIGDFQNKKYSFDDFDDWINANQFWKLEDNISDLYLSETYKELNLSTNELCCPVYDIPFEWQNTGVYIKYRKPLKVEFISGNKYCSFPFKSKIHIGSHSDFLRYKEKKILRRIPLINKIYNWNILESSCITIDSPCEGIVYFEYIPNIELSSTIEPLTKLNKDQSYNNIIGMIKFITLNEDEVELTPIYTIDKLKINTCLGDNRRVITDINVWTRIFSKENKKFSNLLPAWIELHGKKIILTIPSRVLYRINCFMVDDLLEFWDRVVDTQNELYYNYKWTKERIVCDTQISDGYMHSGYPILTHLDIVEEHLETGGLLDLKTLKKEGNWGIYHELGHNRQSDYWTFNGTEEVTVNLFTMYSYYKLHPNLYPFNISYVIDQISLGIEYLLEINSEKEVPENMELIFREKWMTNHGIAFCNYLILIILFGWDTFKTVFQVYDRLLEIDKEIIQTQNNEQKMATWIIIFSSVVGVNLKDFFFQWGWWFCMESAKSEIDIQTLCVRIQNHLMNIKKIYVKSEVSKDDIILGYEDLALINGWESWRIDSLEALLDIQY
ncbi:uncharacterized protein cubi_01885 [Cryptosporidium ubiquitum]|uniref:Peptidase M60 domain-containing protein n=1 Tax=Cryptosporidium ubiquitum TaxID=857276 RepID=A0A1J4MQT3_9CRYT|nr:uncharacterized protein cubi_01885 [Cryptosporidium ubiquitum]OII75364.1 hypothetical protein cubi_01885 [Cryptosporidium ubiquitum]